MPTTLYRGGVIHSAAAPFAQALLVADGRVAWLGDDDAVHAAGPVDEVVDLDGALVTPAFVDAHAHVLETGFALAGVDLSGAASLAAALAALGEAAREHRATGDAAPLLGFGWDESAWPERRRPTRTEVDAVTGGAPVYLARVDAHGAVVSTSFAAVSGCDAEPGYDDGWVVREAHHRARTVAREVDAARRAELCRRALAAAAAAGIVALHEQSAPFLDTRAGLADLLATTASADSGLPLVVGYRAEACASADEARDLAAAIPGLTGIGGDLNVDGSIGSRTAALRQRYADLPADAPDAAGRLYLTAGQVADHVAAVTPTGLQTAFHVIGDRAMAEVLRGVQGAAEHLGAGAVRAGGHRLEHAEMLDAAALAEVLLLGLSVSAQPAFDAHWGGPDGLYAQRLGPVRAAGLNPFADLAAAGVPLAFGSDSPVTPFDPWGAVRAAVFHHESDQRVSARAAFRAHTRGGWRLGRERGGAAGQIALGAPAHLAIWRADTLTVQAPDHRVAAWSTDARAGTPLLPELGPDLPSPRCLRTLRDGVVIHDAWDR